MNDQIRKIREMMAGLNLTQEEVRKECFPEMNASRFSFILNIERQEAELDKLYRHLQARYIATLGGKK